LSIFLLLRVARVKTTEAFGVSIKSLGSALFRGLVFLLALIPPVWLLAWMSQAICEALRLPVEPQDMAQLFLGTDSLATRIAIAVLAIAAAPLFEELFFRGLAYPALKQKIGPVPAMLLTSLAFAAIHFHSLSFLPLAGLAVGLTLAYEVTDNLAVPIVMHSLFNLMSISVMVMVPT